LCTGEDNRTGVKAGKRLVYGGARTKSGKIEGKKKKTNLKSGRKSGPEVGGGKG